MKTKVEIAGLYKHACITGAQIENPDSYYWYGWVAFLEGEPLVQLLTDVDEWQDAYVRGWEDAKGSSELESL